MTPPRQLVLPLPERVSLERDDYFVSASNRPALEAVEAWPSWTGGMLAVIGPDGAGKSHLAGLHARRSGAVRWPAVGPDLSPTASEIPAEVRHAGRNVSSGRPLPPEHLRLRNP